MPAFKLQTRLLTIESRDDYVEFCVMQFTLLQVLVEASN